MKAILDLRGLVLHSFYRARYQTVPAAVEEFVRSYLSPLLEDYQPIDVIAVLEGASHNHRRRAVLPNYKAKKEQDADDPAIAEAKVESVKAVQSLILGLGGMLVKTPLAEADDTVKYLVERLSPYDELTVWTVDGDLLQCADQAAVMMVDRSTGAIEHCMTYKGMDLITEAPIEMVRLYKSIVGDSSDGYVGVKGMGETAWANLLELYGYDGLLELDGIVSRSDWAQIEGSECKLLSKLYENREQWKVSHYLAMLHPEWCEQNYGERMVRPQWAKRVPSEERITKVLEPLGLMHLMPLFRQVLPRQWLIDANLLKKMQQGGSWAKMIADMKASPIVGFDWESYDELKHLPYQEARKGGYVDMLNQRLTGASFCFGPNLQYSFYLPTNHRDTANCQPEVVHGFLEDLEGTQLVAHNARFEMTVAKTNFDYDFPAEMLPFDTGIMISYVDENGDQGLKKLSKSWLNYDQINYSDVVPEGGDMRDVSGKEVLHYGADDSVVCAHMAVLFTVIMRCEQTWDFYKANEPFFDKALLAPSLKGIPIDYARLAELKSEDDDLFEKTEIEVRELLAEHCAQVNELGFAQLWPEIRDFQVATMQSKGKNKEEIESKLVELREITHQRCVYRDFAPPLVPISKTAISHAARSIGLPAIRSLRKPKLEDWIASVEAQDRAFAEQREVKTCITEGQFEFMMRLRHAAPYLEFESKLPSPTLEETKEFQQYLAAIYAVDKELWEGDELNCGSSLQMAHLFYGKMNLPIKIRNISKNDEDVRSQFDLEGAPSTNEIAIRTWMVELEPTDWRFQVLERILTIRGIRTRRQLYYKPYPLWQSPIDGNIHPGIRNCGTITKRPSGTSPNILQVSKTKDDGKMRSCFLPQNENEVIVSIDFVQQELAILAGLSRDPNLLQCYVGDNKKDVHSMTACSIMSMTERRKGRKGYAYEEYVSFREDKKHPLHKLAETTRKKYAKTTNFLIVYGGSASGLARKVIVPLAMAEEFNESFHNTYPLVQVFQDNTIKFARRHGFVKTAFGNRKHCDGILDKNSGKRSAWERQAINAPIQMGAADILKITLREYVNRRIAEITGATIYAPVYDEIVASVPKDQVVTYIRMMEDIMEMMLPGTPVRLSTSVSIGKNWGQQIELDTHPTAELIEATLLEIA